MCFTKMAYNVLRICEVRIAQTFKLNSNLNRVWLIYLVSKRFYYGTYRQRISNKMVE
jgi:hypothetical protein